jgi:uncharacterized protein (DUF362 family)
VQFDDWRFDSRVGIVSTTPTYPSAAPFGPSTRYPEYRGASFASEHNYAYEAVRSSLALLGLDAGNLGRREWNPLGGIVAPGNTVLLKPNLITPSHGTRPEEWEQVITHGSIIRAISDYVALALDGTGTIIVADGPSTESDWKGIRERLGLDAIKEYYCSRGVDYRLLDLRRRVWNQTDGIVTERLEQQGDPRGYTTIELSAQSAFGDYTLSGRFQGADYDTRETLSYHSSGRHAYVLCRTPLEADVVINLPKLKVHKKTGVTLSLKNMVGINGLRNCLPHHTIGTPAQGGDEFPDSRVWNRLQSKSISLFKRVLAARGGVGGKFARTAKSTGRLVFGDTANVVRSGNWYGNDTTWRMVHDLYRALVYFDGDGCRRETVRRHFTLIDGIIGGEGNGPIAPDPVLSGVIIAGANPVAVDSVATTFMGFDVGCVPVVARAWAEHVLPLVCFPADAIDIRSNILAFQGGLAVLAGAKTTAFRPHFGWVGHVELDRADPGDK